jgi:hypothetical protein
VTTNGIDRSSASGGSGAAVTPVDTNVVDAKGDLIVGTADNAVDNLTVGANETRLVADSAQATGLKYVADTTNYAIGAKGDMLVGTAADTLQAVTVGANAKVMTADSTATPGVAWLEVPLPRGYLAGLALANNAGDATNDIDFAVGAARNSTNVANLVAETAMTKRLDAAWAAGTAQGGRMSAAAIADTTYHCYAILKDSDGTVDFGFDTSATAPTMPSGYTFFRRIGSIFRTIGAIRPFIQDGDKFVLKTAPLLELNASNPGTAAVTLTMANAPTGIRVEAILSAMVSTADATGAAAFRVSDLSVDDVAASLTTAQVIGVFSGSGSTVLATVETRVFTNTSAQVRYRAGLSSANTTYLIAIAGWVDRRGRDA